MSGGECPYCGEPQPRRQKLLGRLPLVLAATLLASGACLAWGREAGWPGMARDALGRAVRKPHGAVPLALTLAAILVPLRWARPLPGNPPANDWLQRIRYDLGSIVPGLLAAGAGGLAALVPSPLAWISLGSLGLLLPACRRRQYGLLLLLPAPLAWLAIYCPGHW